MVLSTQPLNGHVAAAPIDARRYTRHARGLTTTSTVLPPHFRHICYRYLGSPKLSDT